MFKQRPVLWVIGKSIFRIWHDLNFTFIKNIVKNQWLWDCCIFRSHTTSVSGEKAALVITCLPIFLFHNKCWVEFVVGWQFYKLNFLQMRGESNSDLTLLHCLCHNQLGALPLEFQVCYTSRSQYLHHAVPGLRSSAPMAWWIIGNYVGISKESNFPLKDKQLSSAWVTVVFCSFLGSALKILKIVDHSKARLWIQITVCVSFSPPALLINAN